MFSDSFLKVPHKKLKKFPDKHPYKKVKTTNMSSNPIVPLNISSQGLALGVS